MYNQQIIYSTSEPTNMWTYSPVKYWPNGTDSQNADNAPSNTAGEVTSGGKLSFFAFAPYTAATSTSYAYSTATDTKPTALGGAATTSDEKIKTTGATTGVTAITHNDWNGNVWVKYSLGSADNSANENNFVDLLWGTRGSVNYDKAGSNTDDGATVGTDYNINLTKQTVDERVSFLFKHALAKVGGASHSGATETTEGNPAKGGFKVVVDIDGNNGDNQTSYFPAGFDNTETLVTIKEVKIQDGYSAGQDATITTVENTTKSNMNTYGWFNIETGQWCNEANTYGKVGDNGARYDIQVLHTNTDVTDAIYSLNEKIRELPAGAGKFGSATDGDKELKDATGNKWSTAYPTGVKTTPIDLFANEDVPALMVIPGGSADLYVTVDYYVRTADPALSAGFTQVEQKITNKVSLGTLNPNKYYTIIMHLGLTSVKFEAVVADWAANNTEAYDEETGEDESTGDANEEKVWLPSNVVSYTRSADVAYSATSYTFDGSALGLGDFVSGTNTGNITAVAQNATTTNADITLAANSTTATVSTVTTLTYELGKVTLTINQAPVAITATCDNSSISTGNAVTLTVTNSSTSSAIAVGSYTVGVYTDSSCAIPADTAAFTDTTGTNGKVTFNTAGTYYIKVTSGESTVITSAITVS